MSHFFSQIGKVFSKVWDFIRPIVMVVAVVAAIYFTAGMALSAMPATASFAAAMPGFASGGTIGFGIGAGAQAGTGVFSTLAAETGMGSGLAAGAIEGGTSTTALAGAGFSAAEIGTGATSALASGAAVTAGATDAGVAAGAGGLVPGATVGAGSGAAAGTTVVAGGGAAAAGGAGAAAVGMSLSDKLLLASLGTNLVSGLTSPSPSDIQAAKEGFYGSFYGMDANGQTAPAPNLSVGPQTQPGNTSDVMPGVNAPGTQTPTTGTLGATQAGGFQGVQKPQLIAPVATAATQAPNTNNAPLVGGTTPLAKPQLIGPPPSVQPSAPTGTAQVSTAKPVTGVAPA